MDQGLNIAGSASDLDAKMAEAFPAQHANEVGQWLAIFDGKALYDAAHPGANRPGPSKGDRPKSGPTQERYAAFVSRIAQEKGYRGFSRTQVDQIIKRVRDYDRPLLKSLLGCPIPRRGLGAFVDAELTENSVRTARGEPAMTAEELAERLKGWLGSTDSTPAPKPSPEQWEVALARITKILDGLHERDRKRVVIPLIEHLEHLA